VRPDTAWDTIERTLVGLLGALAMLVGIVQIAGRYIVPAYAISWAEEVIVYLVVWGVMIISSQLVRTDGHVRPDLVLRLLPPALCPPEERSIHSAAGSTSCWAHSSLKMLALPPTPEQLLFLPVRPT